MGENAEQGKVQCVQESEAAHFTVCVCVMDRVPIFFSLSTDKYSGTLIYKGIYAGNCCQWISVGVEPAYDSELIAREGSYSIPGGGYLLHNYGPAEPRRETSGTFLHMPAHPAHCLDLHSAGCTPAAIYNTPMPEGPRTKRSSRSRSVKDMSLNRVL